MNPENDTSTGDDGLTEIERSEVAADVASAGAATTEAAAEAAAAATATAAFAAAAAQSAALKTEDPNANTAGAIKEAAEAMTAAAKALATANAPKAETLAAAAVVAARDFDAERVALKAQYDAGAIEEDEYESAREKILEDRADARAQATVRKELETARTVDVQADWDRTVSRFTQDMGNAALFENDVRQRAFNAQVHVAAAANPTGSHLDWLNAAKETTLKAFGVIAADPTEEAKRQEAIAKATAERAVAAGKPAPTLDRAPQAGSSIATGQDAQLDNLPISDLEDTLARLPADKLEAYLASAPGGLKDNPRAA